MNFCLENTWKLPLGSKCLILGPNSQAFDPTELPFECKGLSFRPIRVTLRMQGLKLAYRYLQAPEEKKFEKQKT